MPQRSILKKRPEDLSYGQPFETNNFGNIEEEDLYIYGNPYSSSDKRLPMGIISIDDSPVQERPLSPISMRLKREMEKIDRNRGIQSEPKEENHWTPRIGVTGGQDQRNDWAEEEEQFRRRYQTGMNPEPTDKSLELEKLRIQQMAAIQAGILTSSDKSNKKREPSPAKSPLRYSSVLFCAILYLSLICIHFRHNTRRRSSESSPKRFRRRSPSVSPRRRRSPSPRRRSPSPRRRSRGRSRSRSRSRDRSRGYRRSLSRSRSRTPPRRRSPNPMSEAINMMSPMAPMMRMPAPGLWPLILSFVVFSLPFP